MYYNVHLLRALFSKCLARKRGNNVNHSFCTTTSITASWLMLLPTFPRRDTYGVFKNIYSHAVWCMYVWAYEKRVCVLFVSSTSDIAFNPSTGSDAHYSQSTKVKYPHFKSRLYLENQDYWTLVLILPNGLNSPGSVMGPSKKYMYTGCLHTYICTIFKQE